MRCPKCRNENPPRAPRCFCGFVFPTGLMTGTYLAGPHDFVGDASGIARSYRASVVAYRWGALMVDTLIAVGLLAPLYLVVRDWRAWVFLLVVTQLVYFLVLEGGWGITLGKLAMGLRVVDKRGRAPGLLRGFLRTLLRPLEVNPLLAPAAVVVLLSRSRQRLGDMLAGTYVLFADDVRRLREPP